MSEMKRIFMMMKDGTAIDVSAKAPPSTSREAATGVASPRMLDQLATDRQEPVSMAAPVATFLRPPPPAVLLILLVARVQVQVPRLLFGVEGLGFGV